MIVAVARAVAAAAVAWLVLGVALATTGATAEDGRASPGRVVSIGGAVTEIVFALGAQDRLVAVDSTSRHPPEAAALPDLGYMRQLSAEPILALEPGLILAVEDAGPPAALDQLRATGVPIVTVPDEPTPDGVLRKVEVVADALGLADRGKALNARLEARLAALSAALDEVRTRPRVLFLLSVGNGGAPLAAGRGTAAAGIIALAGGRNAIEGFEGFKPLSPEAAVTAAPDVVLVSDRTLALLGGEDNLLARPDLAATPAGRNGRVVAMDGLLLLGFGPRTPEAIHELASALHPELSLATLPADE